MAETITEEVPQTKEKLEELIAAAKLQYSLKKYAAAADLYADAAELQDALNGEHAPQNAELLYYYGIALHKVAIAKSDVLGAQVTSEEKKKQSKTEKVQKGASGTSNGTASGSAVKKEETVESTPYFQLTGDENWTDSEGEDDEGEGGDGEEDEDDLQNAYETFEMARVLYAKQLDALDEAGDAAKGKGKAQLTPEAHAIKQKLADCHAFLAELSLESDRPHDAVADARKALELQEELHPLEHENVSEAHYWLSMALELASVAPEEQESGESANDAEQKAQQAPAVNMELRNEAAKHTASVIQSLESRLKIEREALSGDKLTAEEKKEKEIIIKDKAELLEDMKLRLADLQADPKSQAFDSIDSSVMQGILGGLIGADAATQKAKLEEVTRQANDISGLVKTRKKEKAVPAAASASASNDPKSKRKLEVNEDASNGKRAKTEDIA